MKGFALLLATVVSGIASASDVSLPAEPIAVLTPVRYANEAPAPAWARQECQLDAQLAKDMSAALAAQGLGGEATSSADTGRVVKMTIERVIGATGGGWSGPKTLSLSIQLLRDGQVERTSDQNVAATSLNPLAGSCALFERASSKMSATIVKWILSERKARNPAHGAAAASAASAE